MQTSRDSSLLRSLAIAFGDGVAFGVGVKLTQEPGKKKVSSPQRDPSPLAGRLAEIEKRMERIEQTSPGLPSSASMNFDQHALNALVTSFEARLEEHAGHVERLIAEMEVRIALELKSLRQQDQSLTHGMKALHDDLIGLHREFAEAVGAIVEEQVATQVEAGVEKIQQSVAAAVDEKLGALREQVEAKAAEITTLQERLQESDRNVLEVILGMGELCRQVGERLSHQPKKEPSDAESAEMPPSAGVPGFAQHSGRSVLHIPLLSSLALTAVGLYLLYFL
ncbi:MAG TPA: hypothetical protein VLY24_31205 [Bryobacteraceae bacterium]|nr:hypothetical protein [Bryobacteraceae bacterium]